MFKRGYARLMAASVVAISLHALLLVWTGDSSITVATGLKSDSLQVALLPSQQMAKPFDSAQPIEPASKPVVEKIREEKRQQSEKSPLSEPEVSYDDSFEPESLESDQRENREVVSSTKQSAPSKEMTLVPSEIQSTILANVSYPRQARRRGWEGEAAFRFNINSQSVQSVTMLTSTGYPVLDQAAHHGLLSVHSLPLMDGSYRLPVVFRLQ